MYLMIGVVIHFAWAEQEVWKKDGSAFDQGVEEGVLRMQPWGVFEGQLEVVYVLLASEAPFQQPNHTC